MSSNMGKLPSRERLGAHPKEGGHGFLNPDTSVISFFKNHQAFPRWASFTYPLAIYIGCTVQSEHLRLIIKIYFIYLSTLIYFTYTYGFDLHVYDYLL